MFFWSGWRDSNPRSSAPKADALNQAALHPDEKKRMTFGAILFSFFLARQTGFEPVTRRFVVCYSIQLSYWRTYEGCFSTAPQL